MNGKQLLKVGSVALVLGLALSACSGTTEPAEEGKSPIKIGVIATLTGPSADVGQTQVEGIQIAVDEINANGGVDGHEFELVVRDEQLSPTATVKTMREFASAGIKFVAGFTSSADVIAAVPIAEQNGMTIITSSAQSTALATTNFSEHLFMVAPNTSMMNKAAAKFAQTEWKNVKDWQSVGFDYLTTRDSWDEFQKYSSEGMAGLTYSKAIFLPLDGGQLSSYITSLTSTDPSPKTTGLFNSLYGGGAVTFAKQAQPYDLFNKYAVVANVGAGEELPSALGAEMPRMYFIHNYDYSAFDNDVNKKLIEQWKKGPKVGPKTEGPHHWIFEGYTSIMAFANAMEQADSTDPTKVLAALPGMKFESAMGPVYFRAEDHILVAPVTAVECEGDASAKFQYTCENPVVIPGEEVIVAPNPGGK